MPSTSYRARANSPRSLVPTATIRPSAWIATSLAPSSPPVKPVVTFPFPLNVVSRVPSRSIGPRQTSGPPPYLDVADRDDLAVLLDRDPERGVRSPGEVDEHQAIPAEGGVERAVRSVASERNRTNPLGRARAAHGDDLPVRLDRHVLRSVDHLPDVGDDPAVTSERLSRSPGAARARLAGSTARRHARARITGDLGPHRGRHLAPDPGRGIEGALDQPRCQRTRRDASAHTSI